MARHHLLFAAAAACTIAAPASADVTVLGSGNARMCYLAASSIGQPAREDIERCNDAIVEERGGGERLVATHVNRGILRLRRGDLEGALEDFDMATRLDPNEPEAYLNRGSVLLRNARAVDAISQFDTAIAKNTRRPALAHYARAVAYEEAGNVRAAYRDYQRAAELAPDWSQPRAELSRFQVRRN
jgi:tetratricopeptide (TPR) repeat protein